MKECPIQILYERRHDERVKRVQFSFIERARGRVRDDCELLSLAPVVGSDRCADQLREIEEVPPHAELVEVDRAGLPSMENDIVEIQVGVDQSKTALAVAKRRHRIADKALGVRGDLTLRCAELFSRASRAWEEALAEKPVAVQSLARSAARDAVARGMLVQLRDHSRRQPIHLVITAPQDSPRHPA